MLICQMLATIEVERLYCACSAVTIVILITAFWGYVFIIASNLGDFDAPLSCCLRGNAKSSITKNEIQIIALSTVHLVIHCKENKLQMKIIVLCGSKL